jgi:hypothetical protein
MIILKYFFNCTTSTVISAYKHRNDNWKGYYNAHSKSRIKKKKSHKQVKKFSKQIASVARPSNDDEDGDDDYVTSEDDNNSNQNNTLGRTDNNDHNNNDDTTNTAGGTNNTNNDGERGNDPSEDLEYQEVIKINSSGEFATDSLVYATCDWDACTIISSSLNKIVSIASGDKKSTRIPIALNKLNRDQGSRMYIKCVNIKNSSNRRFKPYNKFGQSKADTVRLCSFKNIYLGEIDQAFGKSRNDSIFFCILIQ